MKHWLLIYALLAVNQINAQFNNSELPTSINTDGSPPNNSAILDVNSNTKGLLMPRLTTAQRLAISNPADGLMLFDMNTGSFWYYYKTNWKEVSTGNNNLPSDTWGNQNTTSTEDLKISYGIDVSTEESISISDNYLVVGSPYTDFGKGAVHIFHKISNEWVEQAIIVPEDFNEYGFGRDVDISGDNIIIGAYSDGLNIFDKGTVLIYHRNGSEWTREAKILSEQSTYNTVGLSVAISNEYALLKNTSNLYGTGSVDVYKRVNNTWVKQESLTNAIGSFDSFSISNNYAIVGESDYPTLITRIFYNNGNSWIEQAQLMPDIDTWSGYSIDLSENYAIVGTKEGEEITALIFARSGTHWHQETKLTLPACSSRDLSSITVKMIDNYAIIACNRLYGSPNDNSNNKVYVFQRVGNTWLQQTELVSSDQNNADTKFGLLVDLSENTAVVGSYNFANETSHLHFFEKQ